MERFESSQFGDKNMMLTLEQDSSMGDSRRSFKKKKLQQINKPMSRQKDSVDIIVKKRENISNNENMKLSQKPFNISNSSFRNRQPNNSNKLQSIGDLKKDGKNVDLNRKKEEYESTVVMSEQQDIDDSILLEDEDIEKLEKNREEVVKMNNYFQDVQKKKNQKIQELQNFMSQFNTESDKSLVLEMQKKEIKRLDFMLLQKEDELKSLVNLSRSQQQSNNSSFVSQGGRFQSQQEKKTFITNFDRKSNQRVKYQKLDQINKNSRNDIKKEKEKEKEKEDRRFQIRNKKNFIEKNKKVGLEHKKDQLIELEDIEEKMIMKIMDKDWKEESNPYEIEEMDRLKEIDRKLGLIEHDKKEDINEVLDMEEYRLEEDELKLKEKVLKDLREQGLLQKKLNKINEKIKAINQNDYSVGEERLDRLYGQIKFEKEMEEDELMRKVRELMKEEKTSNDIQKQIYEYLENIDVEQYYKEIQQSQHERLKEGQREVGEMERVMDVVERYIDGLESRGQVYRLEQKWDQRQEQAVYQQQGQYDDSQIDSLVSQIKQIDYQSQEVQVDQQMQQIDYHIEQVVKQANPSLYLVNNNDSYHQSQYNGVISQQQNGDIEVDQQQSDVEVDQQQQNSDEQQIDEEEKEIDG